MDIYSYAIVGLVSQASRQRGGGRGGAERGGRFKGGGKKKVLCPKRYLGEGRGETRVGRAWTGGHETGGILATSAGMGNTLSVCILARVTELEGNYRLRRILLHGGSRGNRSLEKVRERQ